ncbi:MAG: TonB-dependent receptor [Chitinophagaceae bacterium]|nr:TonB-dependent receptor [Chitinophagaceae bacterium]
MKNNWLLVGGKLPAAYIKVFTVMKLTVLLLLLNVCQVTAKVKAQDKITLNLDKITIEKILNIIEEQGYYRFVYNSNLKELRQKISIDVRDAGISDVLKNVLSRTDLLFNILSDNLIVIRENNIRQDIIVKGTVMDANAAPLAGVSVTVKGTNQGVTTDADGKYSISAPEKGTLVFSFVGFQTYEEHVNNQTEINVTLTPSATQQLSEVVVIGYGTATKRDLTGSIARVSGKEIADKPNTNPVASLQGKVAGVSVVNDGIPGKAPDIRIRGTISIGSVKPVYVVDGILNDNIDFLNPNDIESIEILKDPSSLAIFGVRGAAGAIVITTKKAKSGETVVNFSSTYGVKKLVDKIKLTNAEQFKTLYAEQLNNQGSTPFSFTNWTGETDWIDALSQTGYFNANNLSLMSTSEKNKFAMNVGYNLDQGIAKHEELTKILLSINDELKVNKFLKVGFNLSGIRQKLPYDFNYTYTNMSNPLYDARRIAPVLDAYNSQYGVYNTLPGFQSAQITNPLLILENSYNKVSQVEYRTVGNVYFDVSILKDLNFRTTLYGDITNGSSTRYYPSINTYNPDDPSRGVFVDPGNRYTKLRLYDYKINKWQQDYILTYKKSLGDHSINATAGFTTYYQSLAETGLTGSQSTTGDPIPDDKRMWYITNSFVDQSSVKALGTQWERTTVSALFRALYNFQGKYYLNGSFRRDGSSGFANHRWQNFWAVGGAWEVSREGFMADQKIFDFLKIKGSIGVLGNQNTTDNSGVDRPYPSYPLLLGGNNAVFGNTSYPAFSAQYIPDPNLHWETVHAKEIGLELATLNNRLSFEAAYYHKTTKDLLAYIPKLNTTEAKLSNIGSILNKGFEFTAGWKDNISKDFSYSINANLTTMRNKVLSLYSNDPDGITGASEEYPNRTAIGKPIGFFFGYIVEGIYQNQDEVDKSPEVTGFGDYGPGDLKFKDLDGNNTIDSKDRTMIGNPTPKFTYGFSVSLKYKNFDLGIDFQGVSGNQIYRYWGTSELTFAQFNYPLWKMDRWHGEGTSNSIPQLNNNHNINSKGLSTYGIESGSYLRVRNFQLGYNLGSDALSKLRIRNLRLFVSVQNLKTFKNNYGYTPDFGGTATSFGVDNGDNPIPAVYTAGLNVTF